MAETIRKVPITRIGHGVRAGAEGEAAVEEPLEIRLQGRPFAVIMRMPGMDRELTAGFLSSDGVISGGADVELSKAAATATTP